MSEETRGALARAFDAVEAGDLESARQILEPVLAVERNNADAWWIYSHAVTDPEQARDALENVVRINPDYPGASELLTTLRDRLPARSPSAVPISPAAPPPSLPETELEEPDFDTKPNPIVTTETALPETAEPARRSSSLPWIAAAVLLIAIIALLALILNQSQRGVDPGLDQTSTAAAVAMATDEPETPAAAATEAATDEAADEATETAGEAVGGTVDEDATEESALEVTQDAAAESAAQDDEPMPTAEDMTRAAVTEVDATDEADEADEADAVVTLEATTSVATSGDFDSLYAALSDFSIPEGGIDEVTTSLGNTVMASVCSAPGREMRALLPQVMSAIAEQVGDLGDEVEAVGASMVNCETNAPMLTVAVERETAQAFAEGDINTAEFSAGWQPQ